jgi:hypothetical protein
MVNKLLKTVFVFSLCFAVAGCVTVNPHKKHKNKNSSSKIEGQAGRTIPFYSVSIDADYDPRLDNLIVGYKIMSVFLKNESMQAIAMDAKKDRWIVIGDHGEKYHAVNSLKIKDRYAWRELPARLRAMIDYPEIVPTNYSVTFDILLPKNAKLKYFREIRFYSASWRKEFIIEKDN